MPTSRRPGFSEYNDCSAHKPCHRCPFHFPLTNSNCQGDTALSLVSLTAEQILVWRNMRGSPHRCLLVKAYCQSSSFHTTSRRQAFPEYNDAPAPRTATRPFTDQLANCQVTKDRPLSPDREQSCVEERVVRVPHRCLLVKAYCQVSSLSYTSKRLRA